MLLVGSEEHMIDREAGARAGLTVLKVTDRAVTVISAADQRQTDITWDDLIAAAEQSDEDLRAPYAAIHVIAAERLQKLPRSKQGIRVRVTDAGTGNAMFQVSVMDVSGRHRGDLLKADEGSQVPHEWMAEQEASAIRARLGC